MRSSRFSALVACLALSTTALVLAPTGQAVSGTNSPAKRAAAPVTVKVMSQNIMYGGDDYDLATGEYCATTDGCPEALRKIVRIIKVSGADIVGLQEPERNVTRIARRLGWNASPAGHVISRFPIIEPPGANGVYVYVEVRPNKVIAVSNVHLISSPYGPDELRDGATLQQVLRLERTSRLHDLAPQLRELPKLARRGIPVILTGDFNTPSHLDWTQAVADVRADVPFPVQWPVSKALAGIGFVDSYREVHPDPVAKPAFTWTPGGPEGTDGQIMDRIDWILHLGKASTLSSRIVGEEGGPDVDLGFNAPYPTDHRGVITRLAVTPRTAPTYASTQPRPITAGQTIKVHYHTPADRNLRLVLATWRPAGRTWARIPTPRVFGTTKVKIPANLHGRAYLAVVQGKYGFVIEKQAIWVYGRGEKPAVRMDQRTYRFRERMRIRWSKAPGNRLDWVGIIPCNPTGGCNNGNYVRYDYTQSRVEGTLVVDRRHGPMEGTDGWPLPPGQYIARLFLDDSYVSIAQSRRFTVKRN